MDKNDTDLALLVWARLVRVAQKVGRAGGEQLRRYNLTPAQFEVLRHIKTREQPTQQDLVELFDVTRGNVSQLLSKLEADDLVVRVPHGKANVLQLTAKGVELVDQLVSDHDQFIAARFAALSPDELKQLLALLKKLDLGQS